MAGDRRTPLELLREHNKEMKERLIFFKVVLLLVNRF